MLCLVSLTRKTSEIPAPQLSRSCTELTEHRFVTNLIDIFSVRIVFSQTLPNFRSLLFIVQVAMILNLADDTQRNHYRPTIVAKFVLMNVSLSDVFSEAQGKAVHHGQRAVPGWYGTYWVKGGLNPPPIERFLLEMRSVTGLFCWVPGLAFLGENG